ncbi:MAG: type II toxin-antitoxin system VapC family toxin [Leptolyngbya sp. Prado105]|jgi:PIN domain nuclease of toxin-antitoxin system|nr:type II toxin-antitoxin system VapC family toxin [Leptolyngbya sp. Prado105]
MTSVVADTHALVWYIIQPNRLSNAAALALDNAIGAGNPIYLSAISIVEICYLTERGRLPETVLQRLIETMALPNAPVVTMALDSAIALAIQQIDRTTVPEMPDRIIAATALHLNLPLVTRDQRIQALKTLTTVW